MRKKRIIISGGGTGGHLYPALAIGKKMKERNPRIQIVYVGGTRELERKIMEHHDAAFFPLKIEGLKGKGIKALKSLAFLPLAFAKSLAIVSKTKPCLVVGAGGYSSGPIVLVSSWMKIPTLILEQNKTPGLTNRLLLPWVRKAVTAFESSLPYFKGKGIFLGNPVREEFYTLQPKPRTARFSLLIFGGSQGSHFLNTALVHSLPYLEEKKDNFKIYHQTGKKDWEWVKNSYHSHGFQDVEVSAYFYDMARYFQKADLVICRAGATTIAELIAAQKVSILIPFSKATENHQVFNAKELKRINGAETILEEKFTPQRFARKVLDFMDDKDRIDEMGKNLARLQKKNAAQAISDLCFQLMEQKEYRRIRVG